MREPKMLAAVCVVVGLVGLSGCAAGATDPSAGNAGTAGATTPAAVQVDKSLQSVKVTIKRSLLDQQGTKTDAELVEGARSKGMTAVVQGDSVTYTMTHGQQEEMLAGLRTSMRESNALLIAGGKTSITAIEANDAHTEITVKVDGSRYTAIDAFYVIVFYVQGALYQQFAGVPADQIDVRVQFVDESGKVLNTGSYREWAAKQKTP